MLSILNALLRTIHATIGWGVNWLRHERSAQPGPIERNNRDKHSSVATRGRFPWQRWAFIVWQVSAGARSEGNTWTMAVWVCDGNNMADTRASILIVGIIRARVNKSDRLVKGLTGVGTIIRYAGLEGMIQYLYSLIDCWQSIRLM